MRLLNLERARHVLAEPERLRIAGRVTRVVGLTIEAVLPASAVGGSCTIGMPGGEELAAEIIGFRNKTALLLPIGDVQGVREGAEVRLRTDAPALSVGDALLGRILGPSLEPMDGGEAPLLLHETPLWANPPSAMLRQRIHRPMYTGVRAIDACLTCGEGQRIGLMAGAGVGKSVLLGMLARSASADVVVVALVGERGREVREFVERDLGKEGLARACVIVATGDAPAIARVRAAAAATAVAEYFRRRGKRVLLLVDSLTRVAMAQREIGLAAGEPPTSKGYPPSVFALLPRLLERAGNDGGTGSITGMYTVLVEGDDLSDPIADSARSILDGHFVLSRTLANAGHFPAIDVLASVSRVMTDVAASEHQALARGLRDILAAYQESADLIEIGAYQKGTSERTDRAIACIQRVRTFLQQNTHERSSIEVTLKRMRDATRGEA